MIRKIPLLFLAFALSSCSLDFLIKKKPVYYSTEKHINISFTTKREVNAILLDKANKVLGWKRIPSGRNIFSPEVASLRIWEDKNEDDEYQWTERCTTLSTTETDVKIDFYSAFCLRIGERPEAQFGNHGSILSIHPYDDPWTLGKVMKFTSGLHIFGEATNTNKVTLLILTGMDEMKQKEILSSIDQSASRVWIYIENDDQDIQNNSLSLAESLIEVERSRNDLEVSSISTEAGSWLLKKSIDNCDICTKPGVLAILPMIQNDQKIISNKAIQE